ncbi:histidinol-phosphate transaminase [Thiomicrorhabdus sp.]|uniref:histidinol-phosphate transaminase n=1 Tax=Thiomicrorhabdus sp. TaxID=2039724 RepID=UPI0029C89973|nr:histidinol-phosphate transaminase [Thiomicrorhabdus sp.]
MNDSTMLFEDLVNPEVLTVQPYVPGKPIDELKREMRISYVTKLASNENPLGSSLKISTGLIAMSNEISRYPDGSSFALREKLAQFIQKPMDWVTIGNGSNELLELVARVFAGRGDEIIYSQYGFAVYPISAQVVGATGVEVPAKEFGHDLEAILNAINEKTKLIYLANPNNPTGTYFDKETWEDFISQVPEKVIVVLDEAYFEYAQDLCAPGTYANGLDYVEDYPNLLVSRTFSKVYGLSSLRVGYMVGYPQVLDYINRLKQPFSVNSYAQAAAMISLTDPQFVKKSLLTNSQGMRQITDFLNSKSIDFIPSVANFVTVNLGDKALELNQKLLQEGVIVRPLAGYQMQEYLRVSIGTNVENRHFLGALNKLL